MPHARYLSGIRLTSKSLTETHILQGYILYICTPIINKGEGGNTYNIGERLGDLLLRLDTKRALKVNRVFLLNPPRVLQRTKKKASNWRIVRIVLLSPPSDRRTFTPPLWFSRPKWNCKHQAEFYVLGVDGSCGIRMTMYREGFSEKNSQHANTDAVWQSILSEVHVSFVDIILPGRTRGRNVLFEK